MTPNPFIPLAPQGGAEKVTLPSAVSSGLPTLVPFLLGLHRLGVQAWGAPGGLGQTRKMSLQKSWKRLHQQGTGEGAGDGCPGPQGGVGSM